jgi:hypothetical protein
VEGNSRHVEHGRSLAETSRRSARVPGYAFAPENAVFKAVRNRFGRAVLMRSEAGA